MKAEFKRAVIPDDIRRLLAFDRKAFRKSDWFTTEQWREYESWWMIVDGHTVGCCAFQANVDFQDDILRDDADVPMKGSLYIATTGILPKYQHAGYGKLLKCWQITYAKHQGYRRIVTNTRKRNVRMIALNKKFGFQVIRTTAGYYTRPPDATIVMELKFRSAKP